MTLSADLPPCRICGRSTGNKSFAAREMMLGYRDEFVYFECSECGCVQIAQFPENLMRYYPPEYSPKPPIFCNDSVIKQFMLKQRAAYCLHCRTLLGKILAWKYGRPTAPIFGKPDYYTWLRQCEVSFSDRILDVGCGGGDLLVRLSRDGFRRLEGVDPFIPETVHVGGRFMIWRKTLFEVDGAFNLIMMHHSFEHMPEPREVLVRAFQMLLPGGNLVIRIPVASSLAYREYGSNWVQLDAPRHFFLHTVKSMQLLAETTGFKIEKVDYDSSAFQFWASEQYRQNISLRDSRSFIINPSQSIFTLPQIAVFAAQAAALNRQGQGDSACFYLRRN